MFQVQFQEQSIPWTPLEISGLSIKVLHQDDQSGALTMLLKMAAGSTFPEHSHSVADESAYIISGDLQEGAATYGPGGFFVAKQGVKHGPHRTKEGCVMLTHFTGEVDFQVAD